MLTISTLSSKFNFLTDLLCPFGVPNLVVGGDVTKHQNPANAQGVCLGDKGGVLTLLPNDNRPVVRRGLRGMPYSKDWCLWSPVMVLSCSNQRWSTLKRVLLVTLRKLLARLIRWELYYLHSVSDRSPSVQNKVTVPTLLLKPKWSQITAGEFLLWKGRLVASGHMVDPNMYDPYDRHAPTVPLEVAKMDWLLSLR